MHNHTNIFCLLITKHHQKLFSLYQWYTKLNDSGMLVLIKMLLSHPVLNKCSAVAEMGDRLATIDMGRKVGAVPLFKSSWVPHLTQCRLDRGLPS